MSQPRAASEIRTFSQVIEDLGSPNKPKLYIGELVDAFGERGFGALMLVLAILNALPLPPGATTILGAPLLLLSIQLVARQDQVWMPKWLMKTFIDRRAYRVASMKAIKPIRKIEALSRPRLCILTSGVGEVVIGVACVLLCIVLVLPIPLGNISPALTIAMFSLGLMQRDGYAVILGWIGTLISIALLVLAWTAVVAIGQNAWTWVTGLI